MSRSPKRYLRSPNSTSSSSSLEDRDRFNRRDEGRYSRQDRDYRRDHNNDERDYRRNYDRNSPRRDDDFRRDDYRNRDNRNSRKSTSQKRRYRDDSPRRSRSSSPEAKRRRIANSDEDRVAYRSYRQREGERNQREFDTEIDKQNVGREKTHGQRMEHFRNSQNPPPLGSIHHGEVHSVMPFGVFVKLPGFVQHGLVHISQISNRRVNSESLRELLAVNELVWVKVIPSEQDDPKQNKVSLSMRYVDQSTGADLDPNNAELGMQQQRGKNAPPVFQSSRFELGAILKTTCTRCGFEGHFANECYNIGSGNNAFKEEFELIGRDEIPVELIPKKKETIWREKPEKEKEKHKHKDKKHKKDKDKKKSKHKKDKK